MDSTDMCRARASSVRSQPTPTAQAVFRPGLGIDKAVLRPGLGIDNGRVLQFEHRFSVASLPGLTIRPGQC
jgi:hypothetical protein